MGAYSEVQEGYRARTELKFGIKNMWSIRGGDTAWPLAVCPSHVSHWGHMVHTWLVTRLILSHVSKPCAVTRLIPKPCAKPCVPLSVKITLLLTHGLWHGLFLTRVPTRVSRGGVFFFEKYFTNLISNFPELDYIISQVSHVLYYDSKPVLTC